MAEYKAIHGTLFQHKTSDPKATGVAGAAWASGGNLNQARYSGASSGIQTAAILMVGDAGPGSNVDTVEQYN